MTFTFSDFSFCYHAWMFSCRGYYAPEYLDHGKMSARSNIYSLGVIIIKIVTGSKKRPNINNVSDLSYHCTENTPFYNYEKNPSWVIRFHALELYIVQRIQFLMGLSSQRLCETCVKCGIEQGKFLLVASTADWGATCCNFPYTHEFKYYCLRKQQVYWLKTMKQRI